MTWATNYDGLHRALIVGDRLERIALDETKGDDFSNWQNLYRDLMETLAGHQPLDLDELLTGYNDAPEGLSGGAA